MRRGFSLVELSGVSQGKRNAFTLVELLVVVAIIVVLLAILLPGLDKAVYAAEKARCLANQRGLAQSLRTYAGEFRGVMPIWQYPACYGSAYDMRDAAGYYTEPAHPQEPAGFGLLVATQLVPGSKIFHCPCINNMGAIYPADGADYSGIGMDVVVAGGSVVGASYWHPYPNVRVVVSYNYRAVSFQLAGKGLLKASNASSGLILTMDLADLRFGGKFLHPDGYNRAFGDGHAGFYADPDREIDAQIAQYTASKGYFDGTFYPMDEEKLYDGDLARDR